MTDTETQLDLIEKGPLPDEAAVEPKEEVATETAEEPEKVEASEDDTQEEQSDEGSDEEPEKPKRRSRNRTAKLAAKLTNAEQQIAALTQQITALQPPAPEVQPPKQEDFTTHDEFDAAKTQYIAEKIVAERMQGLNQQVEQATLRAESQHQEAEWNKKEDKARDRYADYDEVARDEDLTISSHMADALKAMDDGPDVAYHLGSHPDIATRIAQLPPVSQVIELGRIANKLSPPQRKQTKAPPPVTTVKGGSVPSALTPENAQSMDEFVKARKAQEEAGQT